MHPMHTTLVVLEYAYYKGVEQARLKLVVPNVTFVAFVSP